MEPDTRHPVALLSQIVASSAIAAILVFALVRRRGEDVSFVLLAALVAFAAVSVILVVIDVRSRRLPDRIVLPAIAFFLGALALDGAVHVDGALIIRGLIGAAIPFVLFWVIATIKPGSIGGGDVKFVALTSGTAAWVSVEASVLALFFAFLSAGVVSLIFLMTRRLRMSDSLPFGPFLAVGAWCGIALGA